MEPHNSNNPTVKKMMAETSERFDEQAAEEDPKRKTLAVQHAEIFTFVGPGRPEPPVAPDGEDLLTMLNCAGHEVSENTLRFVLRRFIWAVQHKDSSLVDRLNPNFRFHYEDECALMRMEEGEYEDCGDAVDDED